MFGNTVESFRKGDELLVSDGKVVDDGLRVKYGIESSGVL